VYSLLAHKEFRFLYPILPLSFIYAGKAIQQMKLAHARWYNVMWFIVILPHVLFAAYFGLLHQRGTIAAMGTLRDDAENISSVDFLMPCHHAPGYAHLHVGKHIPMRHLDCSPTSDNTMDEADVFHENPLQFVKNTYKTAIPSHIVLYQDMGDKLAPYLREKKFKKIASHFHMYLPHVHDRRMSEYVDVYKRDV
jgi:phosphatidylinositol glycan class B